MKKKLPFLLIALGVVTALCAALIVSCAISPSGSDEEETPTSAISVTDTEILTEGEHLAATEPDNSDQHKVTEATTDPQISETHESTPSIETESEAPSPSLEYSSNGNGTCTLVGIGTYTESYVSIPAKSPDGDVVISISEQAFFENNAIKAVEIPSTVISIGDMAFAGCESLIYITVSKDNVMFTDIGGVLYTKDLSKLLCYPSGNGASSVTIPSSVISISPMAFYQCDSLRSIIYEGSDNDWSKITIGDKNYGLYTAAVSFTDEKLP